MRDTICACSECGARLDEEPLRVCYYCQNEIGDEAMMKWRIIMPDGDEHWADLHMDCYDKERLKTLMQRISGKRTEVEDVPS